MPDGSLPIVFRSSLRNAVIMAAIGAVALFAAFIKITGEDSKSVKFFRVIEISGPTAGWLFLAAGVVMVGVGVMSGLGRCPALTIGEGGIELRRCRKAPVQIPWSALAEVTVLALPTFSASWLNRTYDAVYVVTKDGKSHDVGPVGKAREVEAAIRRVAARRGHALG